MTSYRRPLFAQPRYLLHAVTWMALAVGFAVLYWWPELEERWR